MSETDQGVTVLHSAAGMRNRPEGVPCAYLQAGWWTLALLQPIVFHLQAGKTLIGEGAPMSVNIFNPVVSRDQYATLSDHYVALREALQIAERRQQELLIALRALEAEMRRPGTDSPTAIWADRLAALLTEHDGA